ncbi:hypothetical protein QR680_011977 [Steinernema hermaphroditum]|uniref:Uncharacterized protein n=1 Tax=Steinernema hermaphroditum TaxID=289476 RepID=A0AA39I1P9_9BILA|nr:hypothetical protein QR680_011977 [Steinernema hermaphroditum]
MDSVPVAFCEDAVRRLSTGFEGLSLLESPLWRAAAEKAKHRVRSTVFLYNIYDADIQAWASERDQWQSWVGDINAPESDRIPLEEVAANPNDFHPFDYLIIYTGDQIKIGLPVVSNDKLNYEVMPFVFSRMAHSSTLQSFKDLAFIDFHNNYIKKAKIRYLQGQTLQPLEWWIASEALEELVLEGLWPEESEAYVNDLLMQFVKSERYVKLHLDYKFVSYVGFEAPFFDDVFAYCCTNRRAHRRVFKGRTLMKKGELQEILNKYDEALVLEQVDCEEDYVVYRCRSSYMELTFSDSIRTSIWWDNELDSVFYAESEL